MNKNLLLGALGTAGVTLAPKVLAWTSAVADILVYWTVSSPDIMSAAHMAYQGLIYAPLVAFGAYVGVKAASLHNGE